MSKGTCSATSCDNPHYARGLCRRHYGRATYIRSTRTPDDRFWAKVDRSGDCWIWQGAVTPFGYGHLRRNKRYLAAHRLSYELQHGPVPDGLVIDHTCHVPSCVNPSHLQAVPQALNSQNLIGPHPTNKTSGVRGVSLDTSTGRWIVRAKSLGVSYYGGLFDSLDDATEAAIALRNRVMTNNLKDAGARSTSPGSA